MPASWRQGSFVACATFRSCTSRPAGALGDAEGMQMGQLWAGHHKQGNVLYLVSRAASAAA